MKTERWKEIKSQYSCVFREYTFLWLFLLEVLSPCSSTISCRERNSSFHALAKLLGAVICHPFLSGCLGELDTPLQHSPLFRVLRRIVVPEIVNENSSSPGFGSPDSAESLWIICMEMERHKHLAEISETWCSRILSKAFRSVLNSQGTPHFHWFLPSPSGGYSRPLKEQK